MDEDEDEDETDGVVRGIKDQNIDDEWVVRAEWTRVRGVEGTRVHGAEGTRVCQ